MICFQERSEVACPPHPPAQRWGRTENTACALLSDKQTSTSPSLCRGVRGAQRIWLPSLCRGSGGHNSLVPYARRRRFASPSKIHDGDASRRRQRFTTATLRVAVQDSQRRRFASLSEIHDGDAKIWTVIRSAYGQDRIIEFTFKIFLNVNSMIRDLPTVRIVSLNSHSKYF